MGPKEASTAESENSVVPYWQERPVKYTFPGGAYIVEEVKTPWDLFAEGRWLNNPIGTEFHQCLVKNGVERIFSLRSKDGYPFCDIITRPKDAAVVSIDWGPHRCLNTSNPMTINDQKLIVIDAIAGGGRRVGESWLRLVRDFFVSQGGVLNEEHPSGLVFSNSKEAKEWRVIVEKNEKTDIMISSGVLKLDPKHARPCIAHAPNLEIAIMLLRGRYWYRCHIDGNEEWTADVLTHMESVPDDQPAVMDVYGKSDHAKVIFARAKAMYEVKKKK